MEFVLLLVATLVVTGLVAAFIASRPRKSKTDLEPPPASPLPPSPPKPPSGPRRGRIPPAEELDRQAAEVVAEAEALLAAAQAKAAPEPEEALEGAEAEAIPELEVVPEPEPDEVEPEEVVRPRFRDRLGKARSLLSGYLGSIRSKEKIDDETWDDLEEALVRADVGVKAASAMLDELKGRVKRRGHRHARRAARRPEGGPEEEPDRRRPLAAFRARGPQRLAVRGRERSGQDDDHRQARRASRRPKVAP